MSARRKHPFRLSHRNSDLVKLQRFSRPRNLGRPKVPRKRLPFLRLLPSSMLGNLFCQKFLNSVSSSLNSVNSSLNSVSSSLNSVNSGLKGNLGRRTNMLRQISNASVLT